MKNILIVIVVLAILGGGAALVFGNKDTNTENTATNTSPATTQSTTTADKDTTATITYTDQGFEPGTLTVKAGTKITLTNSSSGVLIFSSDPHPDHTDDPELNQAELAAGQSGSFTPTVIGTHGAHNHEDPTKTMTLIVE